MLSDACQILHKSTAICTAHVTKPPCTLLQEVIRSLDNVYIECNAKGIHEYITTKTRKRNYVQQLSRHVSYSCRDAWCALRSVVTRFLLSRSRLVRLAVGSKRFSSDISYLSADIYHTPLLLRTRLIDFLLLGHNFVVTRIGFACSRPWRGQ